MAKVRGKGNEVPSAEEVLTELEKAVDRAKILYEQYFLGIQKMPPDAQRRIINRGIQELSRENLRNTAQRYRFNMLRQKVQTYGAYWDRTLRQIENGTYHRSIARAGREAVRKGQDLPDELLRAMPEKMRERMINELAASKARHAAAAGVVGNPDDDGIGDIEECTGPGLAALAPEMARPLAPAAPPPRPPPGQVAKGVFSLDDGDGDWDGAVDTLFAEIQSGPVRVTLPPSGPAPNTSPRPAAGRAMPPAPAPAPRLAAGGAMPPESPPRAAAAGAMPTAPAPRPAVGGAMPVAPIRPSASPPSSPRVPGGASATNAPARVPPLAAQPSPSSTRVAASNAAGGPTSGAAGRVAVPATAGPPRTGAPPTARAATAPAAAGGALPGGMSEDRARKIFDQYVKAKRLLGEDTSGIKYEQMVRTLSAQAPKILKDHGAKSVDFEVQIKDDKVVLKAKPIK